MTEVGCLQAVDKGNQQDVARGRENGKCCQVVETATQVDGEKQKRFPIFNIVGISGSVKSTPPLFQFTMSEYSVQSGLTRLYCTTLLFPEDVHAASYRGGARTRDVIRNWRLIEDREVPDQRTKPQQK